MLECCAKMPDAHPMREGRLRLRPIFCRAHFRKYLHSEEDFHQAARQAMGRSKHVGQEMMGTIGLSTQGRVSRMEGEGLFRAQLSFAILRSSTRRCEITSCPS